MKKSRLAFGALIVCFACTQIQAGIITSVRAVSSSAPWTGGDPSVVSEGPKIETLSEGVNIFLDRAPGHRLVNIPAEFEGDAQVIAASNSDKTLATYQLEVTTGSLGLIYVGLDSRFRDMQPLPWMQDTSMTGLPTVFFDTGRTIDIDEGSTLATAGDDIESPMNLWATIAPAGTYNFFEQTFGGGSNNYFIAADNKLIVPEPASVLLLVMGLVGLVANRRRN